MTEAGPAEGLSTSEREPATGRVPASAPEPFHELASSYELKSEPEAFQVCERLDWAAVRRVPLAKAPQQLWLVEKRNLNTLDLIRHLARGLGVPQVELGYAGRKDRRALTRQWLSLPNRYPAAEVRALLNELAEQPDTRARGLTVLGCQRKLRIGALLGNRFRLKVRLRRPPDPERLQAALEQLKASGFPNFFGVQRVNATAVAAAARQLIDRRSAGGHRRRQRSGDRGWALSVIRSNLFNQVLAARLAGDAVSLEGGSGPLWGRGRPGVDAATAAFEARVLAPSEALLDCLEHAGLRQERRPLVVRATEFDARLEGTWLHLRFALPPGSYATELVAYLFRLCGGQPANAQSAGSEPHRNCGFQP